MKKELTTAIALLATSKEAFFNGQAEDDDAKRRNHINAGFKCIDACVEILAAIGGRTDDCVVQEIRSSIGEYAETRTYLDNRGVRYTVDEDGFLHLTEWLRIYKGKSESVTLDGIKSGNVVVDEGATYNCQNHTTGDVVVDEGATYNAPNHTMGEVVVWGGGTYNGKTYKRTTKFKARSK